MDKEYNYSWDDLNEEDIEEESSEELKKFNDSIKTTVIIRGVIEDENGLREYR